MPSHQPNIYVFLGSFKREWGPVVRALCLNVAAPSSDPTLTSGLDLLLVASCKLAFLITFLLRPRPHVSRYFLHPQLFLS